MIFSAVRQNTYISYKTVFKQAWRPSPPIKPASKHPSFRNNRHKKTLLVPASKNLAECNSYLLPSNSLFVLPIELPASSSAHIHHLRFLLSPIFFRIINNSGGPDSMDFNAGILHQNGVIVKKKFFIGSRAT